MKKVIIGIFILLIASCATASKMNDIKFGMTKDEVINLLGNPVSVSSDGISEYLNYRFSETSNEAFSDILRPYYIEIKDGRVTKYGRKGDFQRKEIDIDMELKKK